MEQSSRSPSQRRNERRGREERLQRRGRQGKGSNFEKRSSHISDGMRNRIKDIHFHTRRKWGVRAAGQKCVNKVDESGVNVARALRSQGEKDIIRVGMMPRVVRMLLVASNLRSLGMGSFVGGTRG